MYTVCSSILMFDRILADILPLQLEGDELAFNIRPLDTIMYRKGNFKELANHSIDEAIIQTGTTVRPTRALTSSENLIKYLSVLGLRVTQLNTEEANALYKMGQPLDFMLLDGQDIVYFRLFQFVFQMAETARSLILMLRKRCWNHPITPIQNFYLTPFRSCNPGGWKKSSCNVRTRVNEGVKVSSRRCRSAVVIVSGVYLLTDEIRKEIARYQ